KKVLLPDLRAGCSLADNCLPDDFAAFKAQYPNHKVVTYINTSAQIKAMSDYVCTSSNAEKIIRSIPENQPLLVAPDKNLRAYLSQRTRRNIVPWEGSCILHEAFSLAKPIDLVVTPPGAKLVAHPAAEQAVLRIAHAVGSTSQMRTYIINSTAKTL